MPVKGFKSITIKDTVYDYYFKRFEAQQKELALKGINNFSSYFVACVDGSILP